jgi:hypothetical protein
VNLRLRDLLARKGDPLQLDALTGELGLDRVVPDSEVASPGLALAGYTGRFAPQRLHVLGETEITYLFSLDESARKQSLETLFGFDLPAVFVTKGRRSPRKCSSLPAGAASPVLRTKLKTAEFYRRIKPDPGRGVRPPDHAARLAGGRLLGWDFSSSAAPASARASAFWTWSNGATAWWPTISSR